MFREVFKELLLSHVPGAIIEEAGSGEEVMQKIKEATPHLIFTDMRLPGINGLQITQKIKKDFPKVRVVLLSGYDLEGYREAAIQHGADHFFVKDALNWDEIKAFVKTSEG